MASPTAAHRVAQVKGTCGVRRDELNVEPLTGQGVAAAVVVCGLDHVSASTPWQRLDPNIQKPWSSNFYASDSWGSGELIGAPQR